MGLRDHVARSADVDPFERHVGWRLLDNAGDVQDRIAVLREAVDRCRVADVALARCHARRPLAHFVVRMPRDEYDVVTASHELGHCARAHDSCPARDEDFHAAAEGREGASDGRHMPSQPMVDSACYFSPMRPAVLLLSGGLDSTTMLALAVQQGFDVHAMTFRYGQRHSSEIEAARRVARAYGVRDHVVADIDLRTFGGSALTADIDVPKDRTDAAILKGIPITYVPARNTIFLSFC